jgi:hypothetical protein
MGFLDIILVLSLLRCLKAKKWSFVELAIGFII